MRVGIYPQFRRWIRLVGCAMISLGTSVAMAGHYVVTYSTSGSFTATHSAPTSKNYTPASPGVYHGSSTYDGMFYGLPQPSTLGASGAIQATATWTPENSSDTSTPPPNVMVIENATAKFTSDTSLIGSGSADNGLGATASSPGSGSWVAINATSTRYSVKVGSNTIPFSISPSISVGPVYYSGSSAGVSATVSYSVALYPITIDLNGPVSTSTGPALAVGQKLIATVNTHGLPTNSGDTYTWTAPSAGNPFANYVATSSSATFTAFSLPGTSSKSLSCYFSQPSSPTIQCVFHSGLTGKDANLSTSVSVQGPTRSELTHSCGTMQLLTGSNPNFVIWNGTGNPTSFHLWGGSYTDALGTLHTWGIYQRDSLTDPPCLSTRGKWSYVQTLNRTSTYNGTPSSVSGLDSHAFPYPDDPWYDADGSTVGKFEDAPGFDPIAVSSSGSYNGQFKCYIFYKAPDDAAGTSVYIPTTLVTWKAVRSFDGTSGTWTMSDDHSGFDGDTSPYPLPFPTW